MDARRLSATLQSKTAFVIQGRAKGLRVITRWNFSWGMLVLFCCDGASPAQDDRVSGYKRKDRGTGLELRLVNDGCGGGYVGCSKIWLAHSRLHAGGEHA